MATFLKSLSIRARLTALFVILFGTTTIFFSAALYYSLNDSLLQDFDNALFNYSIDVSRNIKFGDANNLLLMIDEGKIFPFSSGTALILIRHSSGTILSQTTNLGKLEFPYKKEFQNIKDGADSSYTTLEDVADFPDAEADSYRLITFPVYNMPPSTIFLQIAVPMTTFETQLERFMRIISIGLPSLLLLAIFLGLYFSSRALRPVKQLIQNIDQIDINHLSDRIPLPQSRDEIRQLAETQNLMLNRIEKAFQSQERFIADASHQLLTPLTILRGQIELKLKNESDDKTFLKSLLQETDSLAKIVKDMLLLARIDAGNETANFKKVEIEEILLDAVIRTQKIATEKNITIKVEIKEIADRKSVLGEPDLLYNLFFNILENAIKYSSPKQNINVLITWDTYCTSIDVIDEGIGIPKEKIQTIFDRFSRANANSSTPGFGLGLAISKKIAVLHGFELVLVPKNSNGAHFQIKISHPA